MTINLADNTPRVSYNVAEGVTQTSFVVSFEFFADADLNLYVDNVLKTLTTDYTVSGGSGSTGTATISVTGATGGSVVTITRDIALERTTDFPSQGAFQIDSLNTELDKITAQFADRKDDVDRAMILADSDSAVSMTIPLKADRLGSVLAFNATTGAPEAGPTIGDVSTVAAITADIATLADIEDGTDATDAIQTVAGISANVTTVAGVSSNVTTVAGISADVTSVAGDATDIGKVAAIDSDVTSVAAIDSDVTTVAGISANVTTVAGDSADITALAAKTTEIGLLGTADAIADMNTLATSAIVTDMDALADLNTELDALGDVTADITTVAGIQANVTTVAGISANTTTVAGISSDVTTVAGIQANVTTVAGDAADIATVAGISSDVTTVAGDSADISTVAGVSTEVGRLGTADAVADMNTLGTADVVADMNTLGTAAIVSDMDTLADISSNITTVAGISANVTTVAGDSADIGTVAGISSDVSTVATNNANVTTVATNITGVNSFADRYRVGATDPTTSLDEGDLFFNTTDNGYKFYDGSSWQTVNVSGIGNVSEDTTPELGGNLDLNSNDITGTGNIDVTGTVTADGLTVDGNIDASYTGDSTTSVRTSHDGTTGFIASANFGTGYTDLDIEGKDVYIKRGIFGSVDAIKAEGSSGDISFYDSTGTTQGLFWDASTQRLGLGSTTPVQKLDVYGGNIAVSSADTYQTAVNIDNTDTGGRHFGLHSTGSNSTAGRFRIYDYDANAERMTIDSSGNVSLGNGKFLQFKDSGGTARDVLTIDAFNGLNINSAGGGSAAPIVFKENGSEVARFDSSGNLLIGKTSDTYNTAGSVIRASGMIRATVSGDAAAQFNRLTNNGTLLNFSRSGSTVGSVSVTTSGTTYNTTSDLRLKTDIEPIADATDRLMAMNAVTHKWKADPDADAVVGFIAQEMQEIVPEAVSGSADSDEMMSMDYGRITPVLVAALQDAHKKIEQLEQRLADMEAK